MASNAAHLCGRVSRPVRPRCWKTELDRGGSSLCAIGPQCIGTMHATKREYRISNEECRMLKLHGREKNFIIRNSMFDIRYSFKNHGKVLIPELPTPGRNA
jgi:hypothetical protein